ncbi:unnamed protein product [Orchesella dallaii]|uniref:Elongation of very long chain fatty acids protein n=1 Tax=Orchesella dallaii TaxID=48710 RepID=A0ABP1QF90_9HEXA
MGTRRKASGNQSSGQAFGNKTDCPMQAVNSSLRKLYQKVVKSDFEAFDLKTPLFYWNAGLGIFSILGLIRFSPSFLTIILKHPDGVYMGVYRSLCLRDGANEPASFWTLLFVLSKYVELGDTVFIVLRKRPLVFLQWYHHMITCCVAWILAPFVEPVARWYIVMNYAVHSVMYPYFALKTRNVHIPRQISNTITSLQLVQMIVGLIVNLYTMFLIKMGDSQCSRHPVSIKVFIIVYGSFTILFGKLFYEAFFLGKRKTKKVE